MSEPGQPPSRLVLLLATVAAAAVWLLYILTASDPVLGEGSARIAIGAAAVIVSAVFAVAFFGTVILGLAPSIWGTSPTGFQRVVVYGLLTFAASFFTLRYFGVQLGAILTTSAIATAAVALAMQPTLGSMIAGLAIHTDRVLHIGDGVMQDGEAVRIVSMTWRMALGHRADGRLVVIPNAKLSDNVVEILPSSAARRMETFFSAPASIPPQRICDLVRELVADFSSVDADQTILVAPLDFGAKDSTRFRIHYWVRPWWDASLVEGEIARRIWYAFQRNRLGQTPADLLSPPGSPENRQSQIDGLRAEIAALLAGSEPDERIDAFAKTGQILLFAPDEPLVMPEWTAGHRYLLLRGEVIPQREFEPGSDDGPAWEPLSVQKPGPAATMQRLTKELGRLIGPFAELAVARAADACRDFEGLCQRVALEIDDAGERTAFLRSVLPERAPHIPAGTILETRRHASGAIVCCQALRAVSEVAVLVVR